MWYSPGGTRLVSASELGWATAGWGGLQLPEEAAAAAGRAAAVQPPAQAQTDPPKDTEAQARWVLPARRAYPPIAPLLTSLPLPPQEHPALDPALKHYLRTCDQVPHLIREIILGLAARGHFAHGEAEMTALSAI